MFVFGPRLLKIGRRKFSVSPLIHQDFDVLSETEDEITFWYNGEWVTYGIVEGQNGTKWMDRNLGARRAAIKGKNDLFAYGDLFQWGRFKDGHEDRNSSTVNEASPNETPPHGDFIIGFEDWLITPNPDLWQSNTRINMPAPDGWRLPTYQEVEDERASWFENSDDGAYTSDLKWTVAGGREFTNGNLGGTGDSGVYWTSTTDLSGESKILNFGHLGASTLSTAPRGYGISVRLIKD